MRVHRSSAPNLGRGKNPFVNKIPLTDIFLSQSTIQCFMVSVDLHIAGVFQGFDSCFGCLFIKLPRMFLGS